MSDTPREGRWATKLLFECVTIVFSILLALAVSQWQDARRDRALADQAIASFRRELAQNRTRLRTLLPYHERIRDEMGRLDQANAIHSYADLQKISGFQGFRPAFLLDTGWRSAVATGALSHVDYRVVNGLSTTYTLQGRLDDMNHIMMSSLLTGSALSDANAATTVRQAAIYLSDVTTAEHELLSAYDGMLADLGRRSTH
jgi:type II secretory pathway pseudopilin PulG